ncbi:benzoate/H(+) symporter BenE family transporter [Arboricoccus pini]|nr:benzoate/H(+) symporter BenE family transporter [Arboricoccus pini]
MREALAGEGGMTPSGDALQPLAAGALAAVVGFASAFTIVLQGLRAAGATPLEAAAGLMAVCLIQGVASIALSLRLRMPISIAWSTPGAVLLIATGTPAGGFPVTVGAFMLTGLLIVIAGLWRGFGEAVAAIPRSLAAAMLAGVLLDLCLAPVHALGAMPHLALPIIIAWALAWRFARRYAVPVTVLVAAIVIGLSTTLPAATLTHVWPVPVLVVPGFDLGAVVNIALPLFIVTMASQNVPGLAVLNGNGYHPPIGSLFVWTGLASILAAPVGGMTVNLAAITAALCAGPEAHPDANRRWIASIALGGTYIVFGLFAGLAAAFIASAPPVLIQTVAGLALLASLASALMGALVREDDRVPAIVTFVTAASGVAVLGIGAAFWGLIAGGVLVGLNRLGRS